MDGIPGDEVLIGYTSMWHLLRWDSRTQGFAQLGFYENGVGIRSVRFADVDQLEEFLSRIEPEIGAGLVTPEKAKVRVYRSTETGRP